MTTTTLIALLASASAGQSPLPGDIVPTQKLTHVLEIAYDPKQPKTDLAGIELVWSDDRGQTWHAYPAVTPDKTHITFQAKGDGLYYLSMVMFTKSGKRIPEDVTSSPPEIKLLIDSTPPKVTLPVARRVGDEVQLEWAIDDKYPNEALTQVVYRPQGNSAGAWTLVPASSFVGRAVKFVPKFPGPIAVRVDVSDYALNTDGVAKELPGGSEAAGGAVVALYNPPPVRPNPVGEGVNSVAPAGATSLEPIPPPSMAMSPGGSLLIAPPSVTPTAAPPVPAIVPAPAVAVTPAFTPTAPLPFTPPPEPAPREPAVAAFTPVGTAPVFTAAPAAPAPPDIKAFNSLRFDVAYDVDGGPSGISRVDLYVTRDDGRTWQRWSQHPQGERPLKVALDHSFTQRNPRPEGDYGFRLVPTSGAGLSEGAPPPGTPPEFRARIDLTPPKLDVFAPQGDPTQRNAMVLRWKVSDANKSPEPVAIEWAETPAGPWVAVTGAATPGADAESLVWVLPEQIPPKVFLRFTATDLAGNKLVTVSNQPFLVDPHRPKARIQGFSAIPATSPRR